MRSLLLPAVVAASIVACGGGSTTPAPAPVVLTITNPEPSLVPGQRVQLSVTALRDGQSVSTAGVTWASSAPAIATVSPSGGVVAVAPGTPGITASLGGASANVQLQVLDGGMVTAMGGTLRAAAGQVELVIPAGAVSQDVAVTVSAAAPPGVDPTAVIGTTWEVGRSTVTFAQPATLRIRYRASDGPHGLPQHRLGVRRVSGISWVDLAASTTDSIDGIVSTPITQSGTYGVGRLRPAAPCNEAAARVLDFWLGTWNVTQGGQPNGQSNITLEPGGCAILEEYLTSTPESPGRSISFHEPVTNRWYQTYVDARGNRLVLESISFAGQAVVMRTPGAGQYQRWSWTAQVDGSVRQFAELTTNNGNTFTPLYDLMYRRR